MAFSKGNSGNPKGRPKGAKNKVATEIADMIGRFVSENIERLQTDIDSMTPIERVRVLTSLLNYVIPKQQPAKQDDPESKPLDLTFQIIDSNGKPLANPEIEPKRGTRLHDN